MDPATILADVQLFMNAASLVGKTLAEVYSGWTQARDIANGTKVLTDAERAALRQQIADMEDNILNTNPDV